jgi:hypothetical protein
MINDVQDANRIGVVKKCCWLCKQLSEAMKDNGLAFDLPGTSGIMFSWAPPTGLDIAILKQVEDRLKTQLFDYLNIFANDAFQEPQSHQLSPTTSLTDISLSDPQIAEAAVESEFASIIKNMFNM